MLPMPKSRRRLPGRSPGLPPPWTRSPAPSRVADGSTILAPERVRLGVLDAAECPPTFHVPPGLITGIIAGGPAALSRATEASEDDPQTGARDLEAAGFRQSDVVAGIAASGRTPYVLGAVKWAKEIGAITCGISCNPDSELSRAVDYPIEPVTGPEVIAGSTRMRSGTSMTT